MYKTFYLSGQIYIMIVKKPRTTMFRLISETSNRLTIMFSIYVFPKHLQCQKLGPKRLLTKAKNNFLNFKKSNKKRQLTALHNFGSYSINFNQCGEWGKYQIYNLSQIEIYKYIVTHHSRFGITRSLHCFGILLLLFNVQR